MFYKLIVSCFQLLIPVFLMAQNVGIGTNNPVTRLHVDGGLLVTSSYQQATANPTAAQHYTIGSTNIPFTDSVFRIYDSGGPNNNYGANENLANSVSYGGGGGSFLSIHIENLDLGPGDSLYLYEINSSTGVPRSTLYAAGNNISQRDIKFKSSLGNLQIIFKSNGVGQDKGFSILVHRNYLLQSQSEPDQIFGNGMVFYPKKAAMKMGLLSNSLIGLNSVEIGSQTKAPGNYSGAFGINSQASGYASFAVGNLNIASGNNAVAMGSDTRASGSGSFSMGRQTIASGENSVALGRTAEASGDFSTAIGYFNTASGEKSLAMGSFTQAIGENSLAAGIRSVALASNSYSMGQHTVSNASGQLVLGNYNDTAANPVSNARIFEIGNGNSFTGRSTSFYITKNGNVWTQGLYTQASDARLKKDIVPLKNVLPKLLSLSGYNYNWKHDNNMPGLQAGLIAQELLQQLPELVSTDSKGIMAVNYSGMVPYLLEGIKEQQSQIDALKNELKSVKEMLLKLTNAKNTSIK